MMTREEQATARAIQTIARELKAPKDVDWEQRRYEIAKDVLSGILSSLEHPNDSQISIDEFSDLSVRYADTLVKRLKESSKE